MYKKWIIFLFIIRLSLQECQKGCLKCDSSENCEFCDILRFYKLQGKECVQVDIENCQSINFDGNCTQCIGDFYLDTSTHNCNSLPPSSLVPNCSFYSSAKNCIRCKTGFYLNESKCKAITKFVSNCEIYEEDGKCSECLRDYALDKGGLVCRLGESEQFCQFYSRTQCLTCKEKYIKNYNLKTQLSFKFESTSQKKNLANLINQIYYNRDLFKFGEVCEKVNVQNCLETMSADRCENCKNGFYLTEDLKCNKFPVPRIDFCIKYNSNYQCTECENNYLLSSDRCQLVETFENCVKYNGSASVTECVECIGEYYSSGGKCVSRNVSVNINNCLETAFKSDRCQKCEDRYIRSSDRIKCFPYISNCLEYPSTSSTASEISCSKCEDSYYLENTRSCILGTIANCKRYKNQSTCLECENQYFLNGGLCKISQTINRCQIYSSLEKDRCIFCVDNYYNFKLDQICVDGVEKPNCVEYTGATNEICSKCGQGFYLVAGQCSPITIPNCLLIENDKCISCAQDYGLDLADTSSPICSPLPSAILTNCQSNSLQNHINTETIENSFCKACTYQTVPIDHREQFLCLENTRLHLAGITEDKRDQNCIKYNLVGNCIQCGGGMYLTPDSKCATRCADDSVGTFFKLQIGHTSSNNFVIKGYNVCD